MVMVGFGNVHRSVCVSDRIGGLGRRAVGWLPDERSRHVGREHSGRNCSSVLRVRCELVVGSIADDEHGMANVGGGERREDRCGVCEEFLLEGANRHKGRCAGDCGELVVWHERAMVGNAGHAARLWPWAGMGSKKDLE